MRNLVLLIFAACTACSAQPGASSVAAVSPVAGSPLVGAPKTAATLARLQALVGTPSCTSDAQCHTLPLGAKACGGPEGYLAWSSAQTREADVRALGDQHAAERRAENSASGMMSTCQFLADPGAICKTGICQLGSGAAMAR